MKFHVLSVGGSVIIVSCIIMAAAWLGLNTSLSSPVQSAKIRQCQWILSRKFKIVKATVCKSAVAYHPIFLSSFVWDSTPSGQEVPVWATLGERLSAYATEENPALSAQGELLTVQFHLHSFVSRLETHCNDDRWYSRITVLGASSVTAQLL